AEGSAAADGDAGQSGLNRVAAPTADNVGSFCGRLITHRLDSVHFEDEWLIVGRSDKIDARRRAEIAPRMPDIDQPAACADEISGEVSTDKSAAQKLTHEGAIKD